MHNIEHLQHIESFGFMGLLRVKSRFLRLPLTHNHSYLDIPTYPT